MESETPRPDHAGGVEPDAGASTPPTATGADTSSGAVGTASAAAGYSPFQSPLLGIAAAVVIVAGLRGFSQQLAPLALGLVLIIAVTPIQGALRKRGVPGWAAMLASLFSAYGILVALLGSLVWSGYQIIDLFRQPEYSQGLADLQESVGERLQSLGVREGAISEAIANIDIQNVLGRLGSALSGIMGLTSSVVLVLVVMFFMATDASPLGRRIKELAADQPLLNAGIDGFVAKTRSYLVVSTVFGAAVAVADGVALWLLGVPLVSVWVVLSFVTNYIPNVGFIVGVIPPALVALLAYDLNRMIWVVIVYSVLNFVIQTLIQPRIVGSSVGLSSTLTFLSLVFWSFVIGPLGAILAVPLTLVTKAFIVDINPRLQWMRPLLSLEPMEQELAPVAANPFDDKAPGAEPSQRG
ncbi:MAG: AI-2E family transporter [Acidimicrobiales bacterium]